MICVSFDVILNRGEGVRGGVMHKVRKCTSRDILTDSKHKRQATGRSVA